MFTLAIISSSTLSCVAFVAITVMAISVLCYALVHQISKRKIFITFYFEAEQAMNFVPVPFLQVVIAKIDHTGSNRCKGVDTVLQSRYHTGFPGMPFCA